MTTVAEPPVEAPVRRGRRARSPLAALAVREGSLLLRSSGFRVGLGLTLVGYGLGYVADQPQARVLVHDNGFFLPFLILCWTVLIVTNQAALRARRDGTTELFEAVPTPASVRTAAHLASVLAAVPVGLALMLGSFVVWRAAPGTLAAVPMALVGAMLLLLLGAGVSGVLVARWAPVALGGPLAVIATIVLQANFGHEDARWRWLHFAPGDAFSPYFDVGYDGWHIPYVAGLVLLGAVLALARHGLTRPVVVGGATALAVLLASGWVQTRAPQGGRVAARVSELENPAAHQVCEERPGARLCAYPRFRPWIPLWDEPVQGVLRRLPATPTRPQLEVRQRASLSVALIPQVESRVDPTAVWAADGAVHPGLEWRMGDHHLTLAFQTAAWAVGLPPAVDHTGSPCSAGGQARTLVALWLAGGSTPQAERSLRERAAAIEREGGASLAAGEPLDVLPDYEHEDRYPDTGYVPEVGAAGRGADLVAAVRLLDHPRERFAPVLARHWDRLLAPATPSAVVFDLVGAPPPPLADTMSPATPGVGSACR